MWAKLKNRLAHPTPAQVLFFLSPVLGEVVSSYQSPLQFLNPLSFVITVFPYGCGALIVRELLVRRRKGWISLVLLGLAFGLFFEGIVTRVIFNPAWEDLGALATYTHLHGFNWTLAVASQHRLRDPAGGDALSGSALPVVDRHAYTGALLRRAAGLDAGDRAVRPVCAAAAGGIGAEFLAAKDKMQGQQQPLVSAFATKGRRYLRKIIYLAVVRRKQLHAGIAVAQRIAHFALIFIA